MADGETDTEHTRTYHSPLREQQAESTRRQILHAAAELILSDGLADFSMRDVASRAGVSERTVYYHFPNRQAVLDGLDKWVEQELEERRLRADPRDVDDLPGRIADIFSAFDEIGAPARAMARLAAARGIRSAGHRERTEQLRERWADVLDPLPPEEADRCFAILRLLASSTTWLTIRHEFGLDQADAAEAIGWGLETLIEDLRRRAG